MNFDEMPTDTPEYTPPTKAERPIDTSIDVVEPGGKPATPAMMFDDIPDETAPEMSFADMPDESMPAPQELELQHDQATETQARWDEEYPLDKMNELADQTANNRLGREIAAAGYKLNAPKPVPQPSALDSVLSNAKEMFKSSAAFKEEKLVPAIRKVQEYVRPLTEVAVAALSNPYRQDNAEEQLLRHGLSTFGGPGLAHGNPQAKADLEAKVGEWAAPKMEIAADMAGSTIPFMLLGRITGAGPAAEAAVLSKVPLAYQTAAPITTKVLGLTARYLGAGAAGAAENAGFAAVQPGSGDLVQDMKSAAKIGFALGGGVSAAADAIPAVVKYFRPVAKAPPEIHQSLANETAAQFADKPTEPGIIQLTEVVEPAPAPLPTKTPVSAKAKPEEISIRMPDPARMKTDQVPTMQPGMKSKVDYPLLDKAPVLKKPQASFKPSTAAVVSDGAGGLKAVVQEMSPEGIRKLEMPLNSDSERAAFGDYAYKHDVRPSVADEAQSFYGSLNPVSRALIERVPLSIPRAEGLAPDVVAALKQIDRDNMKTGNARRPSLDPAPMLQEVVLGVENGRVKFSDDVGLADTAISDTQISGRTITEPNVPQGSAGGKGNTKEIPILYKAMREAEKNKVLSPKEFNRAQDAWLLATGQKSGPITDITPQEVPLPPAPGLGQIPPNELADIADTVKLVRELARTDPKYKTEGGSQTVRKGFLSWFANDNVRGPRQLREWINAMHGAKGLANPAEIAQVRETIRAGMPAKALFDKAARDLDQVHLGRMSMSQFEARHGAVAADIRARTKAMMAEAQANSHELEALGVVPEDLGFMREQGIVDQYQAQVYKANYLGRGQWSKAISTNDLSEGIAYLIEKHPSWSSAEVATEVLEIIRADEPRLRWKESGLNKPVGHLKKKEVIPPQIEKLLGKETSGVIKMAVTLPTQRSLIRQLKVWNEVANDPRYFSPDAQPGFIRLEPTRGKYGNAAGGYVHQDLMPLIDSANAPSNGLAASHMLGAWVKRNQVVLGGLKPWVNNVMRNIIPSHLSGGMSMFHPARNGEYMREALAAMKAWKANPVKGSAGDIFMEAKSVGALSSSQGAAEMNLHSNQMLEEVAKAMGTEKDLFSGLTKVRNSLTKLNHAPDKLAHAYDAIDTTFKLANYISLKKQFLKKGLDNEAAARAAADRINHNFINFEHTGRLAKKGKESPFGFFAPYLTSNMEALRVMGLIPKQIAEDPAFKWRLLSLGIGLGGITQGLRASGVLNGVTDDDVDEANAISSQQGQQFSPYRQAAPFRDAQGRVQFWNLSDWVPELKLAEGMPGDPLFAKIASNLMKQPISGGVLEPGFDHFVSASGLLSKREKPAPRDLKAEDGLLKMIAPYFHGGGLIPGAITSTYQTLRKSGVVGQLGRNEEQLTPGQGVARMALPSAQPVSLPSETGHAASPSFRGGLTEYHVQKSALEKQMDSIRRSQRTPEEKRELLKQTHQLIKQLQLDYRSRLSTSQRQ